MTQPSCNSPNSLHVNGVRNAAGSTDGDVPARPRILMIAEACNPEWQSVPLVGYNWFRAISAQANVTLVTQIRNRNALLKVRRPSDRFEFVDSERVAAPFHKLGSLVTLGRGAGWTTKQLINWLPYIYFERLVFKMFRQRLSEKQFDLIHRVTPVSPTYPSPLASWVDVPFMLGPLNGGLPWPKGTTRVRFAEMEWASYFRDAYRLMPYVSSTYARAACILAGSEYTKSALPKPARQRVAYMQENGIDPSRFHAEGRTPPSKVSPFRILFVGRLVPYKGADMVLEAFASSALLRSRAEFIVVGDGPQKSQLMTMIREAGLAERVRLVGSVPQSEVADYFRSSSLFAFPSLREFGGAVAMEAMACGLPALVLDYGGPAEIVTPETGVKIPIGGRDQIVRAIRDALERFLAEPERLDDMSTKGAALGRERHSWSAKAKAVVALYQQIAGMNHVSATTR